MRMTKSSSAANRTVVAVLTADPAFEQSVRATFGASGRSSCASCPARSPASTNSTPKASPSSSSISTPAAARRWQALERMMLRTGGVAAGGGGRRRASTPRWRAACCRCGWRISWSSRCSRSSWCGPARGSRARRATETTEAQIYTFIPAVGGAGVTTLAIQTALLLLNSGQRVRPDHLPGRSRFPARRLRRLSRSRTAARPQGNRAAAGTARPPASRDHAVAPRLGPRGDRGAEPAGRDAHLRSRHGDAAARSRVVALRLCRDRHAAHLVLVDRQRAARHQQAVHRQRNDGAEHPAGQGAGRRDPRAARRRAAAAGRSSTASSSACSIPA